jgi:Cell wall-active antibiotics response LiaF, C-terminal
VIRRGRGPPAEHRAVFSRLVRRGPLALGGASSYLAVFGTVDLDLREATLLAAEVELTIRNIFGTVRVLVPEGVDVRLDGGGLFASQHVDTSPRPAPGAPVLRIHASGPGGTLYVRTPQPRRWPDRLTS